MRINLDNLREHIARDILNDSSITLEDDQDLLLSGLLDSLNILKLVNHLENQFTLEIPPEDVLIEHFGSLSKIETYLSTRIA